MTDIGGKVALITGAAQGAGRASALAFAHAGARVVASDIDGSALTNLAAVANTITRVLDVLSADAIYAAADEIDRIDILFNCPGVVRDGAIHKMTDADLAVCFAGATYATGQIHIIDGGWKA